MVLNIDLGPTFIALTGETPPTFMDGVSIDPLLKSDKPANSWREDALIEHSGEYKQVNKGCPKLTNAGVGVRLCDYHVMYVV